MKNATPGQNIQATTGSEKLAEGVELLLEKKPYRPFSDGDAITVKHPSGEVTTLLIESEKAGGLLAASYPEAGDFREIDLRFNGELSAMVTTQ